MIDEKIFFDDPIRKKCFNYASQVSSKTNLEKHTKIKEKKFFFWHLKEFFVFDENKVNYSV